MRWSDAMRLHEYTVFEDFLSGREGVYEIGHVRSGIFYAKYVGMTEDLYRRMREYNQPSSNHNDHIARRLFSEYRNLWFHVIRVEGSAWTESRLQKTFGIKEQGLYAFNKRTEGDYTRGVSKSDYLEGH